MTRFARAARPATPAGFGGLAALRATLPSGGAEALVVAPVVVPVAPVEAKAPAPVVEVAPPVVEVEAPAPAVEAPAAPAVEAVARRDAAKATEAFWAQAARALRALPPAAEASTVAWAAEQAEQAAGSAAYFWGQGCWGSPLTAEERASAEKFEQRAEVYGLDAWEAAFAWQPPRIAPALREERLGRLRQTPRAEITALAPKGGVLWREGDSNAHGFTYRCNRTGRREVIHLPAAVARAILAARGEHALVWHEGSSKDGLVYGFAASCGEPTLALLRAEVRARPHGAWDDRYDKFVPVDPAAKAAWDDAHVVWVPQD